MTRRLTMDSKLKYTINNMQKRKCEEVGSGLRWGMLGLVLLVCICVYNLVDLG